MAWETLPETRVDNEQQYLKFLFNFTSYNSTLECSSYWGPSGITRITAATNVDFSNYRYRAIVKDSNRNTLGTLAMESAPNYEGIDFNGYIKSPLYLTIERELKNTAPSQPGAFTQPTGELEIGDTRTISWGASTDAEGNLQKYYLEMSKNNGSWELVDMGVQTNTTQFYVYPWTPAVTTLKFRVRADDNQGLSSAWRESPTYTVTKPKYYWSKYNVSSGNSWSLGGWTQETGGNVAYFGNTVYSTCYVDPNTGSLTLSGVYNVGYSSPPPVGYYMPIDSRFVWKIDSVSPFFYDGNDGKWWSVQRSKTNSVNNPYSYRGSLSQSGVIAIEGTYPLDGIHNDGFWYVRGARVNQSIAPPGIFTAPANGTILKPGQTFNAVFNPTTAPNISLYEVDYRYNTDAWTALVSNTTTSRSLTVTADKTKTKLQFRVRAKNTSNVYSDYVYSPEYTIVHNQAPVLTLKKPDNSDLLNNAIWSLTTYNTNLVFKIKGDDPDASDTVQYRVMINNVVATDWTTLTKGTEFEYTIPANRIAIGSNAVKVSTRDSQGALTELTFLATLSPQSPVDYSSLSNMRWGGYSSPTISLAELISIIK